MLFANWFAQQMGQGFMMMILFRRRGNHVGEEVR